MNVAVQAYDSGRSAQRPSEKSPSESQVSLQRAVRTLRAVRQRYETGRNAHPDARSYSVHVVVDHGDVAWIAAAIEAVEKAIAAGAAEAAAPAASLVIIGDARRSFHVPSRTPNPGVPAKHTP